MSNKLKNITNLIDRNKNEIFFLMIFILGFLPHVQIFPLDATVSGRWFYLPSLGLLALIGTRLKKEYLILIVIPIIIFSLITVKRSFDFRDGFSLYSADIKVDPDNFNLQNNLGVEYFRLGSSEKAAYHFQKSIDLNPYWWTNYNNLGAYYEGKGELDRAMGLYQTAIDNGGYYLAYENVLRLYVKQKKYREALNYAKELRKYFPENKFIVEVEEYLQKLEDQP